MKSWKKVLSFAVSAAMVVAYTPITSAFAADVASTSTVVEDSTTTKTFVIEDKSGKEYAGEGATAARYSITDSAKRTATYVDCNAEGSLAQVPAEITLSDGVTYSVTAVADKAFFGKTSLTKVEVGNNVVSIGSHAFEECVNLTSVSLPNGLDSIGDDAFFYCTRLNEVELPGSLTSLGKGAFYGCEEITAVNIPAGVITVGSYAFAKCKSLTAVTGCAGLTRVNARAFKECSNLKTISLPSAVSYVGDRAFCDCESLSAINLSSSLKTLGSYAFASCYELKSVTLACATVPTAAFQSCSQLKTVTFTNSVKKINKQAFASAGVAKITLPKSVTSVDATAFNSESIKSFAVASGNKKFSAKNGVLFKGKTLVKYPSGKTTAAYTAPTGTKAIGSDAFSGANSLAKIVLSKGVVTIGSRAFYEDYGLKEVKLPSSLTTLKDAAFADCGITKISLPKSVKTIPASAFNRCWDLKTVSMPGVKTIKSQAFFGCDEIASFKVGKSVKSIAGDAFQVKGLKKFTVEKGSKYFKAKSGVLFNAKGTVLVAYPLGRSGSSYSVPKGTVTIGASAFKGSNLKTVTLPTTVTTIKSKAFFDCERLGCQGKGFVIPSSVKTIGSMAVGYCDEGSGPSQRSGMLIICTPGSKAKRYADEADIANTPSAPALSEVNIALSGAGSSATVNVEGAFPGSFKFYSSDKTVCTVSDEGVVTAVGAGSTYVVAAMGTYYLKCAVTVTDAPEAEGEFGNYKAVETEGDLNAFESAYYEANADKSFVAKDNPAVTCYTGDEHIAIFAAVGDESFAEAARKSYGEDIEEYGEIAEDLAWELSQYELQSDLELFSGTSSVANFTGTSSTLDDMKDSIGKTVTNDAMISTSTCCNVAQGFAMGSYPTVLHVYAPAGVTAGAYLFKFSHYPGEYEFLLAQGATFKVVDAGVRYATTSSYGSSNPDEGFERYYTLEYVAAPTSSSSSTMGETINILSTNDAHCSVDYDLSKNTMGYAGLASVVSDAKAKYGNENVALVDLGDAVQGGSLGTLSSGEAIVEIMNAVGYDVSALGNHEFDYGIDTLNKLVSEANHTYVSCNFKYATGSKAGEIVYEPYTIKQFGNVKIAFVGITTPETLTSSNPVIFRDAEGNVLYDFCNDSDGTALYEQVQKTVDAARAAGADYVVAMGHLGQTTRASHWRSDAVIKNTTGIDFFFDGHSHQSYIQDNVKNKLGQVVPITQTGTKLASVDSVVLNTATNEVTISAVGASTVTTVDPVVEGVVKAAKASYDSVLQKVVGATSADLCAKDSNGWIVRSAESNLGDLVADSFKYSMGAEIGVVNGGGVRSNIAQGQITYGDIIDVEPFFNDCSVVEVTGQTVLDMLEMSVYAYPEVFGGFLQVSGLTFEVDASIDSPVVIDSNASFVRVDGERRVSNVKVNGVAIDVDRTYTMATSDYLLGGGNGYSMLTSCKVIKSDVIADSDALISYITDSLRGVVGSEYASPQGQGRVVFKTSPDAAK